MVLARAPWHRLVLRDASARAGLLAGLLVGGTGLVRVDALREVVLLLPVVALGAAFGGRWPRPVLVGLGASLLVSAVAAVGLSWQYLASIAGSLVPLVALGVLVGGLSWAALALWRRGRRLPAVVVRWVPDVAAAGVVVVGLYLAGRPLWQVVRQSPDDPGARYVAGMQARQGLPVDGGRTYAEQTVAWLSWYVGPVALVVALVVLAVLVRRAVLSAQSRRVDAWLPALLVASGSTLLTLLRPGITPDHPWADRRLLIALPLVVALVVTGLCWVVRRAAAADRAWLGVAVAGAVGALVVGPALLATWPHRAGGVERGSLAAVQSVCDALAPGDVVLAVDSRAANEWPQVVRGMCGVPALSTTSGLRADPGRLASTVATVSQEVAARGGRLVLLAADSSQALDRLGVSATPVADTIGPRGRARPGAEAVAHRPAAGPRLARPRPQLTRTPIDQQVTPGTTGWPRHGIPPLRCARCPAPEARSPGAGPCSRRRSVLPPQIRAPVGVAAAAPGRSKDSQPEYGPTSSPLPASDWLPRAPYPRRPIGRGRPGGTGGAAGNLDRLVDSGCADPVSARSWTPPGAAPRHPSRGRPRRRARAGGSEAGTACRRGGPRCHRPR